MALLSGNPDAGPADHSAGGAPVAERGEVIRIVDGDTIVVEIDGGSERVRFIGVDAPELANPGEGRADECGALAAAAATERLLEDRTVELERDASDRDRFGRLLRHVWVVDDAGRRLATELLVAEGAMEARSYPPDTRYDARLDDAERAARDAGLGIWGAC